jgi:tRNA(Ile)-lysidine synthase
MVSTSVGPLSAGRSRNAMVAEVTANLAHLREDATIVVACSGGPDSSALAHLVADARPDLALVLVHVAHGLRDRSTELVDRAVVATHASWLGAELVGCDVEVTSSGQGIEAAARDARYVALRDTAASRGAAAILVGHSADDQAETVLLRIARGAGADGLAAMEVVAADVTRPLLRLRRADLRAFVAGEGLPVATDETNEDDAIRRVRVRRDVLPALQRIGPDPVATLGRLAGLARDDAAALSAAAAAVPDAFRTVGPVVALRSESLRRVPVAIARRVVRRALAGLVDRPPSAATVARILDAPVGDAATLSGGVAFRAERAWRTLLAVDRSPAGTGAPASLAGAGPLTWEPAGLRLRLLLPPTADPTEDPHGPTGDPHDPTVDPHDPTADPDHPTADPGGEQIALTLPGMWAPPRHRIDPARTAPGTVGARYGVTLSDAGEGFEVRAAAPGDRIRGPGGTRRVVDVFRDAGMPREIRSRWPLVWQVAGDERLVWIPGIAVDAELLAAGRREPAVAIQATPW